MQGVDALLVSGGDGTVMACASELIGTEVPLAIIPNGTGNIIAASLRLPLGIAEATELALHGPRQWIDIGVCDSGNAFFAASIGFSAAVMRDASAALKAKAGMVAYMWSAARHLTDRPGAFRLRIDGQPITTQRSDAVLVGNFGQLFTRPRLPRTSLDDGLLEVGVLRLRPLLDWLRQDHPALRSSRRPPLDWHQGRRIMIECGRTLPIERDGDFAGSASRLEVDALPRSLQVCVPRMDLPRAPMTPLRSWVTRDARMLLSPPAKAARRHQAGIARCSWHESAAMP